MVLLQVNPSALGQPATFVQQSTQISNEIGGKWRIEKHDIERLRITVQIVEGILFVYISFPGAKRGDTFLQRRGSAGGIFDEYDFSSAPRQRLQTQRPAARK